MSDVDGKQLLQNTADVDNARSMERERTPEPTKPPPGTVERVLNFRERNLLIGACRQFCDKDGKGDHKAQAKLDRVSKLMSFQETIEYFHMIDDSIEDALFKWQRERNDYLCWKQYSSGGLTLSELKEKAPAVDPSSPPIKPPKAQPEATSHEMRGPERAFHIPSKLDAWIQDVLKISTFPSIAAEYVTELCSKFGINSED